MKTLGKNKVLDTKQIKTYQYKGFEFSIRENNRRDKFLGIIYDKRENREYPQHIITGEYFSLTFKKGIETAKRLIDLQ